MNKDKKDLEGKESKTDLEEREKLTDWRQSKVSKCETQGLSFFCRL